MSGPSQLRLTGITYSALVAVLVSVAGATEGHSILRGPLSSLNLSTGIAQVGSVPVVMGRDMAHEIGRRFSTGSEICITGREDASGLFWTSSAGACGPAAGLSDRLITPASQTRGSDATLLGIVGTGVQGIVGTGVQGIVGTGVQGIVGTGVQGIVGTGVQGIVGTGR